MKQINVHLIAATSLICLIVVLSILVYIQSNSSEQNIPSDVPVQDIIISPEVVTITTNDETTVPAWTRTAYTKHSAHTYLTPNELTETYATISQPDGSIGDIYTYAEDVQMTLSDNTPQAYVVAEIGDLRVSLPYWTEPVVDAIYVEPYQFSTNVQSELIPNVTIQDQINFGDPRLDPMTRFIGFNYTFDISILASELSAYSIAEEWAKSMDTAYGTGTVTQEIIQDLPIYFVRIGQFGRGVAMIFEYNDRVYWISQSYALQDDSSTVSYDQLKQIISQIEFLPST